MPKATACVFDRLTYPADGVTGEQWGGDDTDRDGWRETDTTVGFFFLTNNRFFSTLIAQTERRFRQLRSWRETRRRPTWKSLHRPVYAQYISSLPHACVDPLRVPNSVFTFPKVLPPPPPPVSHRDNNRAHSVRLSPARNQLISFARLPIDRIITSPR